MSMENPVRVADLPNTAELLRDAYLALDALPMRWLAESGHTGIRPAHTAVFEYLDADGTTVSTLAGRARMTKQAMAELVQALEAAGYLTRVADPGDRRAKLVMLTARGRDLIAVVQARVPELERRAEALLGADRLRDLRADLITLRTAAERWR
jgi:DNA-binding MarR family transcriptional regulator